MRTLLILTLMASFASAEPPGIGSPIRKLTFTDIRSLPRNLDDFGSKRAYVFVFVNTTCPLVQRYLPTLNSLEKQYRAKGVQFIAVDSADEDSIVAMATLAVRHEAEFPFVKDFGGVCARALGVQRTPGVALLDGERTLVYRGRIDDQYRLGGTRKEPSRAELQDAIEAVLAGKPVPTTETEVDGCPIEFTSEPPPKPVTYAEHVAPILRKHCVECHRDGGMGPFGLTSYKQASARAEALAEVATDQRMPPWFASHEFGPFTNRRGLTDAERQTLRDWAKTGAAAGDLSKVNPVPPQTNAWLIGEPDRVIKSTTFDLPAQGDIPYQYAVLPHIFLEDTWVTGVQILPDNPRVVHHCNMAHGKLTEKFNEENFITGQVPGGEPMTTEEGTAFCIPAGSVLGLQIHFVSTGKPEKCRIAVGLRHARGPVQRRLRNMQLTDHRFAIPPGAPAHRVTATRMLQHDVLGVGLFSHMHLRGKDMSFVAHYPHGRDETLLIIPNYNFSWQLPYRWEPGKKRLPKGTRLECIAHFDNSAFNPYNPDPKATVRNGPQTHHEMMVGFFFYTHADEKLDLTIDPKTGRAARP